RRVEIAVLQVHEKAVRLVDNAVVEVVDDLLGREARGHFPSCWCLRGDARSVPFSCQEHVATSEGISIALLHAIDGKQISCRSATILPDRHKQGRTTWSAYGTFRRSHRMRAMSGYSVTFPVANPLPGRRKLTPEETSPARPRCDATSEPDIM